MRCYCITVTTYLTYYWKLNGVVDEPGSFISKGVSPLVQALRKIKEERCQWVLTKSLTIEQPVCPKVIGKESDLPQ